MKFALIILVSATGTVGAQQAEELSPASENVMEQSDYDADAWLRVSFEERQRLFESETRDSEWAPTMERAIEEQVAEFDRPLEEVFGVEVCGRLPLCQEEMPPVRLVSLECRWTLCKMEMHWPAGTFRGVIGQQVSFLYALGIDHQGEMHSDDDGSRHRVELIARRRT